MEKKLKSFYFKYYLYKAKRFILGLVILTRFFLSIYNFDSSNIEVSSLPKTKNIKKIEIFDLEIGAYLQNILLSSINSSYYLIYSIIIDSTVKDSKGSLTYNINPINLLDLKFKKIDSKQGEIMLFPSLFYGFFLPDSTVKDLKGISIYYLLPYCDANFNINPGSFSSDIFNFSLYYGNFSIGDSLKSLSIKTIGWLFYVQDFLDIYNYSIIKGSSQSSIKNIFNTKNNIYLYVDNFNLSSSPTSFAIKMDYWIGDWFFINSLSSNLYTQNKYNLLIDASLYNVRIAKLNEYDSSTIGEMNNKSLVDLAYIRV